MNENMNCEIVARNLEDYFNHFAAEGLVEELEAHLDNCELCAHKVEEHGAYLQAMAAFEVEPLTSGEVAHLLRKVRLASQEQQVDRKEVAFFTKGIAAAAVLIFAVTFAINDHLTQWNMAKHERTVAEAGYDFREVSIVIHVPSDMEGVELAIDIPDYFIVDGYEGMQTITWTTDLLKGANQLMLPVFVESNINIEDSHTIAATIGFENNSRTFQLDVDLNSVPKENQGMNIFLIKKLNYI